VIKKPPKASVYPFCIHLVLIFVFVYVGV